MSKRTLVRLLLLCVVFGLVYGGLNLAGAVPPATKNNVTVDNTAANPVPVQQQGTATVSVANTTVPVHEQGTANVDVTNDTLAVTQVPINGGGGSTDLSGGGDVTGSATASAIVIHLVDVSTFELLYLGNIVAEFHGPSAGFPSDYALALTRPVQFDELKCEGSPSGKCSFSWVGDNP